MKGLLTRRSTGCTPPPPGAQWEHYSPYFASVAALVPVKLNIQVVSLVNFENVGCLADLLGHEVHFSGLPLSVT